MSTSLDFNHLAGAVGVPPTMTTVDIAELTGKRHDHIVRDLRKLHEQGVIDLPKFGDLSGINTVDGHPTGTRTIYRLPKRETLILTSGYSAVQRAAIIDRWLALEGQVATPAPAPVPALTKTLDLGRYTELLEAENAILRERTARVPEAAAPAPRPAPRPVPQVGPRPVTPAETAEALRLFNAGVSRYAIAKQLGRNSRVIYRLIERATTQAAQVSA